MWRVVYYTALVVVGSCGFGSNISYIVGIGIVSAYLLSHTIKHNPRWELLLSIGGYILALLICPSFAFSLSALAVLLIICGKEGDGCALLVSQWGFYLSQIYGISSIFVTPLCATVLFGASTFVFSRCKDTLQRKIVVGVSVVSALLLVHATAQHWQLDKVVDESVGEGYGIGRGVERISGRSMPGGGSLIYNNKDRVESPGRCTLYLDHDAKTEYDEGNYRQEQPWIWNYPVAAEPIRMAVMRDGYYLSNLGAGLKRDEGAVLLSLTDGIGIAPAIVSQDGRLICADSDWAIDFLAPYQRNLIRRLVGGDTEFIVFHLFCALLLLTCLLRGVWKQRVAGIALVVCVGMYCTPATWTQAGDVRYVGKKHLWPHTDLGEGVVRALQLQGENVIFGEEGARYLVVGEGSRAHAREETIILLEPHSEVDIDGTRIEALEIPQGTVNEIPDARLLKLSTGKVVAPPIRIGNKGIIATGTPVEAIKKHAQMHRN